ncbi:hypothetical protein [Butyrivibrio proteoclasticus]|uniref:hypothetical protein n=1 Tax=Butyrivibrio proteoclasticus TaxID=43305 RepID=UPI00047C548F|nr:hypothetical protein [Butyrivibrio proteoclasticus]
MGIKKLGEIKLAQRGLALALTAVLVAAPLCVGLWRQSLSEKQNLSENQNLTEEQLEILSIIDDLPRIHNLADDAYLSFVDFNKESSLISEVEIKTLKQYIDEAKEVCSSYLRDAYDNYGNLITNKEKLDTSLEIVDKSLTDAYSYMEEAEKLSGREHDILMKKASHKILLAENVFMISREYYEIENTNLNLFMLNCDKCRTALSRSYDKIEVFRKKLKRPENADKAKDILSDIVRLDQEVTKKVEAGEDYTEDANELVTKLMAWRVYENCLNYREDATLIEYKNGSITTDTTLTVIDENGRGLEKRSEVEYKCVIVTIKFEGDRHPYDSKVKYDFRVCEDGNVQIWDPTNTYSKTILYESKAEVERISAFFDADDGTIAAESRLGEVSENSGHAYMNGSARLMGNLSEIELATFFGDDVPDYYVKMQEYDNQIAQAKAAAQMENPLLKSITKDTVPLSSGASLPGNKYILLLVLIGAVVLATVVGLRLLVNPKKS